MYADKLADVCSFAHLFTKLPQPGDGKVTFAVFESSCHLLTSSLTTQRWRQSR